jgi:hypothetical protein
MQNGTGRSIETKNICNRHAYLANASVFTSPRLDIYSVGIAAAILATLKCSVDTAVAISAPLKCSAGRHALYQQR